MSSLPVVPDFPDGLSEERDELSPLVTFDQVRTEKSIQTMILPAAKRRGHKLVYFQWGLVLARRRLSISSIVITCLDISYLLIFF